VSDPRDEIADAVQYGRLTPDEAEARLRELGLPPLTPEPDPADFDPMAESFWTLPMVVAWIAWRSLSAVTQAWDEYRRQTSYWQHKPWRHGVGGPVHEGWFLKPSAPGSLAILSLKEAYQRAHNTFPKEGLSVEAAKQELWRALSDGTVEATGLATATGSRTQIADYEWHDLGQIEISGRDVVRWREKRGRYSGEGYDDLSFKRRSIVTTWGRQRMEQPALSLPPSMAPDGPGYMPLYCAAQWIATEGGRKDIEPTDVTMWERSYSELLSRISSSEVVVTGIRDGAREKVEGHLFASIRVDYPFAETSIDLMFQDELYLVSHGYLDEEHWRRGFDDSLRSRQGTQWTQLMVLKSDVAKWWPFGLRADAVLSSGSPGRPTSMHLVRLEYEARWQRGEAQKSIAGEAKSLALWLARAHPEAPKLTPKTIENNIRAEHRRRWRDPRK
jgi:hypothetical protein